MTNDQIVSNDQDVGFCATQPVAFLVFFSFWLSAALGVGSGKIQLEQGVLVAANFVVVAISFTWFVLLLPPFARRDSAGPV